MDRLAELEAMNLDRHLIEARQLVQESRTVDIKDVCRPGFSRRMRRLEDLSAFCQRLEGMIAERNSLRAKSTPFHVGDEVEILARRHMNVDSFCSTSVKYDERNNLEFIAKTSDGRTVTVKIATD